MKLFKSKKPKNAANVKNLQFIPTWKIKAILEHPNTQGIDGRDYGPVRHELEDILFERQNRVQEWKLRKAMHGFERARKEFGGKKELEEAAPVAPIVEKTAEVKSAKASENSAPVETSAPFDLDRVEVISHVKEFWKITKENNFSFELVEIPPMIMNF